MGAGYYLSDGGTYSGWHVTKDVLYKTGPRREDYICLARRHDHLTGNSKFTAPETKPLQENAPSACFELKHDGEWTWIKFPSKPEQSVIEILKNAGARWSVKRGAWYITKHITAPEIGLETVAQAEPLRRDAPNRLWLVFEEE